MNRGNFIPTKGIKGKLFYKGNRKHKKLKHQNRLKALKASEIMDKKTNKEEFMIQNYDELDIIY